MKHIYSVVLIIALINIILSGIVYGKQQDPNPGSQMCSSKCDAVLESSYAKLWGVPQALIGIISFSFLALLTVYLIRHHHSWVERIFFLALGIGGLYALRMLYLQAFVIGSFCPYCVTIDGSTILAGALVFYMSKRKRGYVFLR